MQTIKPQRVIIISAFLLASALILRAETMDGTKWKVKVVPDKASADKGAKEFDDEWTFANGKFTSATMLKQGFKPTKYTLETEPGEAEFEIEQSRATNDVVVWVGDIKGTNTIGGLQWKAKDRGDYIYEFKGTRK